MSQSNESCQWQESFPSLKQSHLCDLEISQCSVSRIIYGSKEVTPPRHVPHPASPRLLKSTNQPRWTVPLGIPSLTVERTFKEPLCSDGSSNPGSQGRAREGKLRPKEKEAMRLGSHMAAAECRTATSARFSEFKRILSGTHSPAFRR